MSPVLLGLLVQAADFPNGLAANFSRDPILFTLKSEVGYLRGVPRLLVRYLLPEGSDTLDFLQGNPDPCLAPLHRVSAKDGHGRPRIAASWQSRNRSAVS